jgi:hypothetical protein
LLSLSKAKILIIFLLKKLLHCLNHGYLLLSKKWSWKREIQLLTNWHAHQCIKTFNWATTIILSSSTPQTLLISTETICMLILISLLSTLKLTQRIIK